MPSFAHTLVLPEQALPQLPQLADVVSVTHAPPQRLYPASHANEHAPSTHAGWALARVVVHALPQVPQLEGSVGLPQPPSVPVP